MTDRRASMTKATAARARHANPALRAPGANQGASGSDHPRLRIDSGPSMAPQDASNAGPPTSPPRERGEWTAENPCLPSPLRSPAVFGLC